MANYGLTEVWRHGSAGYSMPGPSAERSVPIRLPIVLPCHRVVAQDASIGGFSCGLPAKRRLLALEGSLSRLRPSGRDR